MSLVQNNWVHFRVVVLRTTICGDGFELVYATLLLLLLLLLWPVFMVRGTPVVFVPADRLLCVEVRVVPSARIVVVVVRTS